MWIYFNKYGTEQISLIHGEPARVGTYGSFEIFSYFDQVDLENTTATIDFERPDGTVVPVSYIMSKKERREFIKFPSENYIAPFENNKTYTGYSFLCEDSALFNMFGTWKATIKIYSEKQIKVSGLIRFNVQEGVDNDERCINTTQYDEIIRELSTKLGIHTKSEVVEELPRPGEANVIYFVLSEDGKYYDYYMWNGLEPEPYTYLGTTNLYTDVFVTKSEKGKPNGVAPLDSVGLIPPEYIAGQRYDYEVYTNYNEFPSEGQINIIYVARETIGEYPRGEYLWDTNSNGYVYLGGDIIKASSVIYNHEASYLKSTDVQGAIDEIIGKYLQPLEFNSSQMTFLFEFYTQRTIATICRFEFKADEGIKGHDGVLRNMEGQVLAYFGLNSAFEVDKIYLVGNGGNGKDIFVITRENDNYYCDIANAVELNNILKNYAKINGTYEAMVVGKAFGVVDPNPNLTFDDSFIYRITADEESIYSGIAEIKEIGGRTVVANQIADTSGVSTEDLGNGVVRTNNNNGSISFVGLCNASQSHDIASFTNTANHEILLITNDNENYFIDYLGTRQNGDIFSIDKNGKIYIKLKMVSGTNYNLTIFPQLIDLTVWYGAGYEPGYNIKDNKAQAVIDWVKDHPEYNEGTIINAKPTELISTSKNLCDQEFEIIEQTDRSISYETKNFIKVFAGKKIFAVSLVGDPQGGIGIKEYDEDFQLVNELFDYSETLSIVPQTNTKYIKVAILNVGEMGDLNVYYGPRDIFTFMPYFKDIFNIDSNKYFPNGMRGTSEVRDTITRIKTINKFNEVDLSTLVWEPVLDSNGEVLPNLYSTNLLADMKNINSSLVYAAICNNYQIRSVQEVTNWIEAYGDKLIAISDKIFVYDSTSSGSIQGTLVYELATPIETPINEPIDFTYTAENQGTEVWNGNVPVYMSIKYKRDLVYKLAEDYSKKQIDENFLSKTDAKQTYAVKDGTEIRLTSGSSLNVVNPKGLSTSEDEFIVRETYNGSTLGAGESKVLAIKGNTYVMNQLLDINKVEPKTVKGVSISIKNGMLHVEGKGESNYQFTIWNNLDNALGHQVFLYSTNSKIVFKSGYLSSADKPIDKLQAPIIGIVFNKDDVFNDDTNACLFDLTLCFGAGNEPTDINDSRIQGIKNWLEKNPAYNLGTLVSTTPTELVSKDMDGNNANSVLTHLTDYATELRGAYGKLENGTITHARDRLTPTQYEKRMGVIDLSDKNIPWQYEAESNTISCLIQGIPDKNYPKGKAVEWRDTPNQKCNRYDIATPRQVSVADHEGKDKIIIINSTVLTIYDSSIKEGDDYASKLQGAILQYELLEPVITPITPKLDFDYLAYNKGIEEWVGTDIPVPCEIGYPSDLAMKLANIKNREEQDSTDNKQNEDIQGLVTKVNNLVQDKVDLFTYATGAKGLVQVDADLLLNAYDNYEGKLIMFYANETAPDKLISIGFVVKSFDNVPHLIEIDRDGMIIKWSIGSNYQTVVSTSKQTLSSEQQAQIAQNLGILKALIYKGSVPTYNDLPKTGNKIGDMWNVTKDGKNYAWDGTNWDDLGGIIDLSNYYDKNKVDELTELTYEEI